MKMEMKEMMFDFVLLVNVLTLFLAVLGYLTNLYFVRKEKKRQNILTFFDYYRKMFASDSFCMLNYKKLNDGSFERNFEDEKMEVKFVQFLGDCDHLATLKTASGISDELNSYMLGWFCQKVIPQLSENEKKAFFWSKAINYLQETASFAETLQGKGG
ncbi:hypothetical protein AB834_04375 [PVC group bacterium (ex Bugula neritina AB1)]|nr:hypothetical protein AB834_04375 [PVC group bacterium (ex Bugula neritina AB1)]